MRRLFTITLGTCLILGCRGDAPAPAPTAPAEPTSPAADPAPTRAPAAEPLAAEPVPAEPAAAPEPDPAPTEHAAIAPADRAPAPAITGPDLLSLSAGAALVSATSHYNSGTLPLFVADGSLESGWQANTDETGPQQAIYEFAAPVSITRIAAGVSEYTLTAPGQPVVFAVGDQADGPWTDLGDLLMTPNVVGFRNIDPPVQARFLRVTLPARATVDSHRVGVDEIFVEGSFVTPPATADFAGHWNGGWLMGTFRMVQDGVRIVGCFTDGRTLEGTVDGRVAVLRFTNVHGFDVTGEYVMSNDEDKPFLMQIFETKDATPAQAFGTFNRVDHVDCRIPGVDKDDNAPAVADPIAAGLAAGEKVAVYDILFDFNKATLRPESGAVLDRITSILNANPDWRLNVEGHTDAVGTDATNQPLSERRAAAAVAGLVSRGIAADRLRSAGFGASRPVADNVTAGGRARNRRVELARITD